MEGGDPLQDPVSLIILLPPGSLLPSCLLGQICQFPFYQGKSSEVYQDHSEIQVRASLYYDGLKLTKFYEAFSFYCNYIGNWRENVADFGGKMQRNKFSSPESLRN